MICTRLPLYAAAHHLIHSRRHVTLHPWVIDYAFSMRIGIIPKHMRLNNHAVEMTQST